MFQLQLWSRQARLLQRSDAICMFVGVQLFHEFKHPTSQLVELGQKLQKYT